MSENLGDNIDLGDWISIYSLEEPITGDVIYRNDKLIRVKPKQSRSTAKDYLLDENGDFLESYGVYLVQIHSKSEFYHYAAILGVQPGDALELFTKAGEPITEMEGQKLVDDEGQSIAVVAQVLTTDTVDAIILTNGISLEFEGVGPKPPIDIIVPAVPPPDEYAKVATEEGDEQLAVSEPEMTVEELLREIMPSIVIKEIPSSERFFPDAVQRQEMYSDFLADMPPDKQKNKKALRELSQRIEHLLSLKQSSVKLNMANKPIGIQQTTFENLGDLTDEVRGAYVPSCVPIYDVRRRLYVDEPSEKSTAEIALTHLVSDVITNYQKELDYSADLFMSEGNRFYSFMDDMFHTNQNPYAAKSGETREAVLAIQEAYIAPNPGIGRQGFTSGLPVSAEEGKLTDDYLTSISVSAGRFLPAKKAFNPKVVDGTLEQPADQVITTGYVLLDTPTMLQARTLTSVPSLFTKIQIADIQQNASLSLADIQITPLLAATADASALIIEKEQVPQITADFWSIWIRNNIYKFLAPIHAFSPAGRLISTLLDSFVPVRADFPQHLSQEVWRFIDRNMGLWIRALQGTRERIMKKLSSAEASQGESYPRIVQSPITYNERVLNDVLLGTLFKSIKIRETTLRNNEFVIMNDLTKAMRGEAFIQYAIILAQLENREPAFDPDFQKLKLENVLRAEQNANVIAEVEKAAASAKPEYNSCQHVRFWSAVIRAKKKETARFIELFQEFLSRFQQEKKGNWIHCSSCQKECCCIHEVMILNEAIHPGRALSLRKKILMEFGGPVFEGHYICKNCGEPIQGIEYDTNLEFDDDGKPISGRAVIEDKPLINEVDLTEIIQKKPEMKWEKESDERLYYVAKMISERAGASLSEEVYRRIVYRAGVFLQLKIPSQEKYNEELAKRKAAGTRVKQVPYDEFVSNHQIASIAALFLFELQTAEPAIEIKQAFLPCKFSLAGYPLEGLNPEEAGTGALNYVACCTASVIRRERPWLLATWFPENDTGRRMAAVRNYMVPTFNAMVGTSKSGVQLPISAEIREILTRKTIDLQLLEKKERPSIHDRLPTSFKPESFINLPEGVSNAPLAEDPNPAISSMNIRDTDKPARDLEYRLRVIYSQLKQQSYEKAAKEGMVITNSQRDTSYADPALLSDIKRGIHQVLGLTPLEEEAHRIAAALRTIDLRNPVATMAGTHVWTPWAPRPIKEPKVEIPKNILYKLFLRNCYTGPSVGFPHKIGYGNKCRNCGFQFPVSPDIIEPETQGKTALDEQGIDYSEAEFDKILAAKREKQSVSFESKKDNPELLKNVAAWAANPIIGDGDAEMWTSAGNIMRSLLEAKQGSVPIARDTAWGDFVMGYDGRRQKLHSILAQNAERRTRAEAVANEFLGALDIITEGPFTVAADTIINAITSPLIQRSVNYKVDNFRSARPMKNFKGGDRFLSTSGEKTWMLLSYEHTSLLDEIFSEHVSHISEAIPQVAEVSKRAGIEIGTWIQRWKELMFEDLDCGFTEKEGKYILRDMLARILLDILDAKSTYYKNLPAGEGQVIPETTTIMKDVFKFAAESILRFSNKVSLPDEKRLSEMLLKRSEAEKNYIINVFDRLDDEEFAIEKQLKKFGIGKWAMGKNVKDYSPELFEHDRQQRIEMGMTDFTAPTEGKKTAADYGFDRLSGPQTLAERGYDARDEEGRGYGEE